MPQLGRNNFACRSPPRILRRRIYRRCQVGARGNGAVAAVRWPQVACPVPAVLVVMADVAVKDRDAMIVVATDTDEPRWNR